MFNKNETTKVKAVAILLLLFHHLFYSMDRVQKSGIKFLISYEKLVQPVAITSRICVWIFVFLSAYGLSYQYKVHKDEESPMQFILKHWISLMKTYWFCYVIILMLYILIVGNPLVVYEYNLKKVFLDFMGWSDFFHTPMLTGVWWYMCFAQILIVLIPIVVAFCEKIGLASLPIGFLLLQYMSGGIQSVYGGKYSNYFMVVILAVICMENQFFDIILQSRESRLQNIGEIIMLGGALAILLVFKYQFKEIDQWQINSVVSANAAFLIIILVSKYLKGKRITKILIFLGKYSGNIFMTHAFIYIYCSDVVYYSHNAVLSYITLLGISLVLAVIIEKIKQIIHYNEAIERIIMQKIRNRHFK